jgi:UDP-N-acetylglucosamine acyltransferase
MIHPTAIISPEAKLGQNVTIGAYSVVNAGVEIGDDSVLHNHVTISGPTKIGKRNQFHPYCSIGGQSQDLKYSAEPTFCEIGDDNNFREFCSVNRGTLPGTVTKIGSHNHFLSYVHIAHDCVVGNHVIFSNNGTLAGHVTVEDHVILGGFSAVHQFCRIGCHAITGGCTKIVQDVAPYMLVDGNPAKARGLNLVGLQRHKFTEDDIRNLKHAYKTIYMRKLNRAQAVAELESTATDSHVAHLAQFIKDSQRGVT